MQLERFSDWNHILYKHNIDNIQYSQLYASLYGDPVMLYMADKGKYAFIIIIINSTFNDFETPYGYGGFHTNTDSIEFHRRFASELMQYFKSIGLIAGIIRFNPLSHISKKSIETTYIRDIAILDIKQYPDHMTSKCRNMIRRGIHNDAEFYFSNNDDDREEFACIYRDMMKRMDGDPFITFDDHYFSRLFSMESTYMNVCRDAEGKFRGGAVFLIGSGSISYYHLSVYSGIRIPGMSNVLLDMGIDKARALNSHTMILGGGVTSSSNDTLLNFKLSFGSLREPFHLGKIIIDKDAYREKIEHYDKQHSKYKNYILRYRYDR